MLNIFHECYDNVILNEDEFAKNNKDYQTVAKAISEFGLVNVIQGPFTLYSQYSNIYRAVSSLGGLLYNRP
ncbi:hypothetical protein AZF37_01390 [endosymbiont 'TC1' of Trimyema compressum]|nr:hypothetical protein AZF37_01390 [endosymbiont 'TC1' of Trimyema compressum]